MSNDSALAERTLAMSVAGTGFLVDRLGQDCAPLQFLRELTQNSIEAILRTPEKVGEIVWDVDWDVHSLTDNYKLCIVDTGCGMTGPDMVRYINQLSSSVHEQSHGGNFGVGAKIAAATRNHAGLIYLSWVEGVGSTIHLWRDPSDGTYGLRQMELPGGRFGHWGHVEDTIRPKKDPAIESHGTKVVLLGNSDEQNTMSAPPGTPAPSVWIARYLNTRYFRFPEGVTVRARQGWEFPRSDTDRNLLRTVTGQEKYLQTHAVSSGEVTLSGATARWWILRDEPALSSNSGWIASSGHMAALHNDELYELSAGRGGVARLQLFGVIFGYQRVVIYVEPDCEAGTDLIPNTARTNLLLAGEPLPWAEWAAEFRSPENFPQAIRELMEEITSHTTSSDHKQAIRERLRHIRELFRLSRYRPTPRGDKLIDDSLSQGGRGRTRNADAERKTSSSGGGAGGRAGNVYGLFLAEDGVPAEEIRIDLVPDVKWISVDDGTRAPGFLEDRAAKFSVEQNLLQINGDFRVYTDLIDRWCELYSHVPGARGEVVEAVHEWFEQTLIESVLGVEALRDSQEWTMEDIAKALSEEALSAAVMPRYHIDVSVRRALGAKLGTLKDKAS
jgi:Histidine kinase-, DNA gyrase B-, and HSP90-like ATPase